MATFIRVVFTISLAVFAATVAQAQSPAATAGAGTYKVSQVFRVGGEGGLGLPDS